MTHLCIRAGQACARGLLGDGSLVQKWRWDAQALRATRRASTFTARSPHDCS